MSLNMKVFILVRNVHREIATILLLLISGFGCATIPKNADPPLKEGGAGETLQRLTTLMMQTPSEPRPAGVPTAAITAPSSMGDGGPGAHFKYLLTLMETPQRGPIPSPEPPPPTEIGEVAQLSPPTVLPLPPEEEARPRELTPSPASPMETAALAPAPSYRIGPEDVINVSVWDNPGLSMDVMVRPDGKISLPLINEIQAADFTPVELSDAITRNLQEYVRDPHVTVSVTQTYSKKIFLVGNVLRPGSYPLRHEMTILQALSLAGGFTTFASPRGMKLIRGTGTKQESRKINHYKMIEGTELDHYMLKPGDTIVIP